MMIDKTQKSDCYKDALEFFGVEGLEKVPAFKTKTKHVPTLDPHYVFEPHATKILLTAFTHNQRTLIYGPPGTGKSTHIEQIAARLNWPCLRVNLDGHITRIDLVGRDIITIRDGHQVTMFEEGILPWCLQRPFILVFDEYNAGRPELMFVLQRLLEAEGALTLVEKQCVIQPHACFRLFATTNTLGTETYGGMDQGTYGINRGQMDRWDLCFPMDYMSEKQEKSVLLGHVPLLGKVAKYQSTLKSMIQTATLLRKSYQNGDLSHILSTRGLISWAKNFLLFKDVDEAFCLSYLYRCSQMDWDVISEIYQRVWNRTLKQIKKHAQET